MIPDDYFDFKPLIKDEDIPYRFVFGPRGYGLAKHNRKKTRNLRKEKNKCSRSR